mmetsp:Transcript_1594/g.3462  ORF Transcript_1594/g.3462 Transcript_1594/m.3462 type:complete len:117 (+) Transcript_1594:2281-2631(+)
MSITARADGILETLDLPYVQVFWYDEIYFLILKETNFEGNATRSRLSGDKFWFRPGKAAVGRRRNQRYTGYFKFEDSNDTGDCVTPAASVVLLIGESVANIFYCAPNYRPCATLRP